MRIDNINRNWIKSLAPLYGHDEAAAITREALGSYLDMKPVDIVLNGDRELTANTVGELDKILNELLKGKPVQYVIGEAWFSGYRLRVDGSVLIPRPETAQLVDMIVKEQADRDDLKVIDLCTGSGAIAIALYKRMNFPEVTAVELDDSALATARRNGMELKCNIRWVKADVLKPDDLPVGKFDVVVSNPPYIPVKETNEVAENVLRYEPKMALFVPDDNPLIFYKSIARWAVRHLDDGGKVYFEINPHYVIDLKQMLAQAGFDDVRVEKDFAGRDRFIIASL